MLCSKVPVCSSEDLDCVESVEIDSKECIERCDGIIVDAINQNKPKDNSKIEQLLKEYENYKFPNKTYVPFPFSLNGKIIFIQLHSHQNIIFQITGSRTSCTLSRYILEVPLLIQLPRFISCFPLIYSRVEKQN